MRKAWIVARHEFGVTVKRVWFLVATFVFPLFLLAIGGGMLLVTHHAVESREEDLAGKKLGVVDRWGGLSREPRDFHIRRYGTEEEARRDLLREDRDIAAYIVVPEDYLEKDARIRVVTRRRPTLLSLERPLVPRGLQGWLIENVLEEVEPERVDRAQHPFPSDFVHLDAAGQPSGESDEETLKRSGVAYAFFLLLFMSIFTASQYLLQGMAEEKENRVMEMVLSSVTPTELMTGKLIGLGAAGLLQMLIWVTMGLAGAVTFAVGIALEPATFLFCLLFYLLGYALFGSLMLGFGALGTNFRESQQMASFWSFIGATPAFIVPALLEAPHGTLARVFSFIPFTAPTTMMARYTLDPKGTPLYDVAASVLLLAGSTWFAVKLSARLYRAGLLLYGKRPGIREIWRWLVSGK